MKRLLPLLLAATFLGALPAAAQVPEIAFDSAANLYVADPANNRVLALTSPLTSSIPQFSGRVLGQANFAHNGINLIDGTGYSTPWGIALDSKGNLYVADALNHRVQKFLRRQSPVASPGSGRRHPAGNQ